MRQRQIGFGDVVSTVQTGQIIDETVSGEGPVVLVLGFPQGRPVHVVVARLPGLLDCLIVTAYDPNPRTWLPGFRHRRP